MPDWIVVVIVMWVIASPLLGLTMIFILRRRMSAARASDRREPRLSNGGACERRVRHSQTPRPEA